MVNMTATSTLNVQQFVDNAKNTASDNETFIYTVAPIYQNCDPSTKSTI